MDVKSDDYFSRENLELPKISRGLFACRLIYSSEVIV